MASYAYKYNDIFDDYVVQREPRNAAPQRNPYREPDRRTRQNPGRAPAADRPDIQKYKKKRSQVERENKRKKRLIIAKLAILFAMFVSLILMAAATYVQTENTKAELETAKQNYWLCLEENNNLKLQLNEAMADKEIEKIAQEQLGLVKVSPKKTREVEIDSYQQQGQ